MICTCTIHLSCGMDKILKAGFPERQSHGRKQSCKSANDLVKIKNWRHKQSHKHDGIGVRRIRIFLFSFDSAYVLVKTRLSESDAEAEG